MKKLNIDLGTYFGIPVRLHWSFWLVLVWIAFVGWREGMDLIDTGLFMIFTLCLFFCVLLHEYGHALTAKRFNINTQDIILSPIGGIARLQNMPKNPTEEVLVAFAGPAVNVVISTVLGVLIFFMGWNFFPAISTPSFKSIELFSVMLFWINIMLVVFNLIPAFPMDGGRVLRAVLSYKWSRLKSTQIAVVSGQFIAGILILLGFWQGQFMLPFIGLFVIITAQAELTNEKRKTRLENTTAADVMKTEFQLFYPDDSIEKLLSVASTTNHNIFMVTDYNGKIQGIINIEKLHAQLQGDADTSLPISLILDNNFQEVYAHQPIQEIVEAFHNRKLSAIAVKTGQIVVGVIIRDQLQMWLNEN